MTLIGNLGADGIGRSGGAVASRRRASASGFTLPPEAGPAIGAATDVQDAGASGDSAPVFAAFMEGLLGLQERGAMDASSTPAVRDREARRHGQALLSALAELQLALIGGGGGSGTPRDGLKSLSERLSVLASTLPAAADPGLQAVVRAIGLRARIELARRVG